MRKLVHYNKELREEVQTVLYRVNFLNGYYQMNTLGNMREIGASGRFERKGALMYLHYLINFVFWVDAKLVYMVSI